MEQREKIVSSYLHKVCLQQQLLIVHGTSGQVIQDSAITLHLGDIWAIYLQDNGPLAIKEGIFGLILLNRSEQTTDHFNVIDRQGIINHHTYQLASGQYKEVLCTAFSTMK